MNEYIGTIMTVVVIPILGVITPFVVSLIRKKTNEIEQKINNAQVSKYVNIAEDAVCTAV